MNLERYQYFNRYDYHDYEFYSEGPKGRISKMVTFSRILNTNLAIYNLALSDLDPVNVKQFLAVVDFSILRIVLSSK
jgi:hypothetical protein